LAGRSGLSMNKRRISWLMAAVAVPALVFGAMASTAFAERGLDPKRASDLAHIALLDDSVLEGGNWTTTSDNFTVSEPPKTAACNNTFAKMQALEKNLAGDRAGRAKNVMEQTPATGEFQYVVESEVTVYKSAASAEAFLAGLRPIYPSDDMTKCLVDQFQGLASGITGAKATPYLPVDDDDPAVGYAGEFKASTYVSPIRVENYVFIEGNTVTSVTFYGPKPVVSKATVEFLMDIQIQSIDLLSGY
jgi:hypothetical protein